MNSVKEVSEVSALANLIAEFLKAKHCGADKAIKAADLHSCFVLTPRQIRHIVNELRLSGVPICSGNEGYYYAANEEEVEKTQRLMRSQANSMLAAAENMGREFAIA